MATTIGIIQADIDETVKRIEDDTKYQVKDIDVLLKLLKFNTYEELFTALKKLLTPEQLKAYEAQVAEMQNLDELTTDIMQVSSAVALISGITAVLCECIRFQPPWTCEMSYHSKNGSETGRVDLECWKQGSINYSPYPRLSSLAERLVPYGLACQDVI